MTSSANDSDAAWREHIRQLLAQARNNQTFVPTPPRQVYLWAPIANQLRVAAQLEWRDQFGIVRYTPEWLESERAYALDPINLPLMDTAIEVTENRGIPGVVADAGPDSWGSHVLELVSPNKTMRAVDRVLGSTGRGVGALRATSVEDPRLLFSRHADNDPLEQIEHACWTVIEGMERDPSLDDLLRIHCVGMGGARPKAEVVVGGREVIAKFQRTNSDYWDIPRVEAACLATARHAGFDVVKSAVVTVNDRSALLVDRFDRRDGQPIHYLSARSLLNAFGEGEMETLPPKGRATYASIVAAALRIGVRNAGEEMFRRMCFNYAIGNTDDHLRNHGFLFEGTWRLAPAFDLVVLGGPAHEIGVGQDGLRRSRGNLLSRVEDFGLGVGIAEDLLMQAVDAARHMGEELDRLEMPAKQRDQVLSRLCSEANS